MDRRAAASAGATPKLDEARLIAAIRWIAVRETRPGCQGVRLDLVREGWVVNSEAGAPDLEKGRNPVPAAGPEGAPHGQLGKRNTPPACRADQSRLER